MKVLITGHKGFIGTNLQNITGWDGVDLPFVDIRKLHMVESAIERYDVVVHLAAKAGVKGSMDDPAGYVETNIRGTYNVAYACWQKGTRLIFASSSSVYEAKSSYARTKQGGEDIINAFVRHGLNACILRFFTVFGEYNRKDMAVYKFIKAIDQGMPIDLYGNCLRDWTYVQDLCQAIEKIVASDIKGIHDAGFGTPRPVMDLITELENIIGRHAEVRQCDKRSFDAHITKANPELMKSLGVDQTDFRKALKNTVSHILPIQK